MDRREFLKTGGLLSAGTAGAYGLPLLPACLTSAKSDAQSESSDAPRWAMVIDLRKCQAAGECTACTEACRTEMNAAFHEDERWDVHLIRKVKIRRTEPVKSAEKPMLLLCNHCENPPCAQACPVQATYRREDGIVIVDGHRCIGCRYCMIACPYNARFYNYKHNEHASKEGYTRRCHGVPESCTFCAHLLDRAADEGKDPALAPACVDACLKKNGEEGRAIYFGDVNDETSDVARMIADPGNSVKALREDLGTQPRVYYIGL